jgi:hypothetical protein
MDAAVTKREYAELRQKALAIPEQAIAEKPRVGGCASGSR